MIMDDDEFETRIFPQEYINFLPQSGYLNYTWGIRLSDYPSIGLLVRKILNHRGH